jgi:RNA polymerase sigma-70 factor (ECF subfamily)
MTVRSAREHIHASVPSEARVAAASAALSHLSERQLLERVAAGDRESLEDLFRRYRPAAFAVAYRALGNEADASDAVQEGFTKAFTVLKSFQGRSAFETWLLRIVHNTAVDLHRERQQQANVRRKAGAESSALGRWAVDQRTPPDQLMEQEQEAWANALRETIRRILKQEGTDWMYRVFWMWVAGLTFSQIAEKLGCCERTARSNMARARAVIFEKLTAQGQSVW